jgi:ubiquinone/menaquinone biosynthesis C-methylase UbiE
MDRVVTSASKDERSPASEKDPARRGFDKLGELLFAAAAFQCMRAACETGLLDSLADAGEEMARQELADKLGIDGRWLDMLLTGACATGLVRRSGAGLYSLTEDVAAAVDDPEWKLFKAAVAFEQYITYPGITDFTESLVNQTNVGIRHFPGEPNETLYERFERQPDLQAVFYEYMNSWSRIGRPVLVEALRGISATRILDVGGGDAVNAIGVVREVPGCRATVLDIAATAGIAKQRVQDAGLAERVDVVVCDIFADPFPPGHDVVLFAHQLVIWSEAENLALIRKANEVLPIGGHVVIFSSMTDDSEDGPLVAAMASVYHACIPSEEGGRIYPWRHYEDWLGTNGFGNVRRVSSTGWTPHGAIVASKVADLH